jgi:hypothetical protein
VTSPQQLQTRWLMFSITPATRMPVFDATSAALRATF